MMPGMDGYEVTRKIREQHHIPIIFLSAKTSDMDKITGLVMGADDYMTKPFNPMELVARVNSQLRRSLQFSQSVPVQRSILEKGGLVIAPDQHSVTLYGKPVELTPKEFDILYLLASHPKQVFSAESIFEQVWGEAYYESGNTVMVHIRTLRKSSEKIWTRTSLSKRSGAWGIHLMTKQRSFRTTMIMLLGLSMLASGAITYGIYKLLQAYYSGVRAEDQLAEYRHFMKSIGDIYFFLILFIPLAILFFWFTKPYVTYFKDISTGIRHLANGDFQHRVQISSKDELGTIAEDVNLASEKLREAVERGFCRNQQGSARR